MSSALLLAHHGYYLHIWESPATEHVASEYSLQIGMEMDRISLRKFAIGEDSRERERDLVVSKAESIHIVAENTMENKE